MTTITKTPVTVLAPTSGAASSTKGAPGASSAWIDIGTYDGGDLFISIQNAGSLGNAGTITVQASPDNGTTVFDYWSLGGDVLIYSSSTLAGLTTATIWVDPGIRYIRVIGYGNTTSACTYTATFSGVTRA